MIHKDRVQCARPDPVGMCPDLVRALSTEQDDILETVAFRRSPILSRLLRYLVEQTIAGRSEQLKSYTIAVDGLARPDTFDAQLDSYPRVQMVRLRKALESHYAERAPRDGQSLYLSSGSYRVRLAEPQEAYPHLFEREADNAAAPRTDPVPVSAKSDRRLLPWWGGVAIVLLVGLATWLSATIWFVGPVPVAGSAAGVRMPTLTVEAKPNATGAATRLATSVLVDGLRRSWVARVRDEGSKQLAAGATKADYRLTLNAGVDHVDAQLTDLRTATVIWTGSSPFDAAHASLAPMVARIAGPYGTIAQAETARLTARDKGSYACILSYFEYVKTRDGAVKMRLEECLKLPADEVRLAAPLDAVRSLATIESRSLPDRAVQLETAAQFARRAVERDGADAYAQYASARIAYVRNRCVTGNFHADRAILANPNDIMIATALAGLAVQCDRTRASAFLDQAFWIRSDGDAAMRAFLVVAAMLLGYDERVAELGGAIRPPAGPQLETYLISETMVAAAQGHRAEAIAYWAEFRALYPNAGKSDDAHLRRVIAADPLRRRILKVLADRGIIPAA